eukprot:TRINITY_DN2004_c0_g1_i8.p1 TRINITY_DN2004_c0_g1~~TRINITY_DN2004_c0_g1_i8.p1  ORF type:complete len:133 (-),score=30.49 TRINITY_DN2004_c0_g1_i8:211-609(-)
MSAGPKYQYLWMDGAKYKKPTDLSAPEYVDHLMDWIEQQLEDPSIFPPTTDQPFPRDFLKIISNIFKRMFRVYAHIYYSHFAEMVTISSGSEAFLNSAYKRFHYFVEEFNLVSKSDMEPLEQLFQQLSAKDK